MTIEDKITSKVIEGIKVLYGQDVTADMVLLQKTKREF